MKCPNCGYDDKASAVKPFKNAMNMYVRKSDGKDAGIFNDDAKEILVGKVGEQVPYVLEKDWKPTPAPVKPITPSK